MEQNAQAFDKSISWVETARENFNAFGQIVKDVAEALEITDLRDFHRALATLPKSRDLAERDHRIWGLQKNKAILNARIARKDAKWSQANQKTGEALNLLTQFQSYVGQPGGVVTKARIFDETVAKGLLVTGSKVISIVVDYSAKMEKLLLGLRKLMVKLHPPPLPTGSFDLVDFPELLAAEILQGLSTPTKGPGVQTTSPITPTDPISDTRTRPTDDLSLSDQPLPNLPLPSGTGPSDPPPPPPAPSTVQSSAPPPSLPQPKLGTSDLPTYLFDCGKASSLPPDSSRFNSTESSLLTGKGKKRSSAIQPPALDHHRNG